jgi:hypothetical protein
MCGVQTGIRNYTKSNLGWTLSMGYRYQQMQATYPWNDWNSEPGILPAPILERTKMHRIELRFGLLFH